MRSVLVNPNHDYYFTKRVELLFWSIWLIFKRYERLGLSMEVVFPEEVVSWSD